MPTMINLVKERAAAKGLYWSCPDPRGIPGQNITKYTDILYFEYGKLSNRDRITCNNLY